MYGGSDVADGQGVHGHGLGDRTEGVLGTANGEHGRGVWGIADGTGSDAYGVSGSSVHADGVEGFTQSADHSGVYGHSDNGWGVYGISSNKPGVVGETSNPNLSGVYGYSASAAGVRGRSEGNAGVVGWTAATGASGVLGHSEVSVGVRGMSETQAGVVGSTSSSAASGVLGHSQTGAGVRGESDENHGVAGVTRSINNSHAGVYARNYGRGPAVFSDGDLYVSGAILGSIGPNDGAPFPRPAYDSGWVALAKGEAHSLIHNIGGNIDDYIILMNQRNIGHGYTNFGDGLYLRDDDWAGYFWDKLSPTTVEIWRGNNDLFSDGFECRVRIWVYR